MRPQLLFFIAFSLKGTQKWLTFGKKFKFETLFYKINLNLKKNHSKSEQISRVHKKLQYSITPQKKTKIIKIFLILNSTLDQLYNDATHISRR